MWRSELSNGRTLMLFTTAVTPGMPFDGALRVLFHHGQGYITRERHNTVVDRKTQIVKNTVVRDHHQLMPHLAG